MITDLFQPEDLETIAHLAAVDERSVLVNRLDEAHYALAVRALNLEGVQRDKIQGAALFAKALADEIREAHDILKKHREKEKKR